MKLPGLRTVGLAGAAFVWPLLTIELLLRGLAGAGALDLHRPDTVREVWARQGWQIDPDLNWAMIRNQEILRGGAISETNSHGLRDQEIPLRKPPGTHRILTLGDSTVLGFGVDFPYTFSEQLEKRLNAAGGGRFQVVNGGVQGYSIYGASTWFRRDGIHFEPDWIVIESNFNDRRYVLSEDYQDGPEFYGRFHRRLRLRETLLRSYLYRGLRRLVRFVVSLPEDVFDGGGRGPFEAHFQYRSIPVEGAVCRVEPGRYREILHETIDFARARGIGVLLVPLLDPPHYVDPFYTAVAAAEADRPDEALELLRQVDEAPFYRLIVARKRNEILASLGRKDERVREIYTPLAWMGTDGNLPIYLADPYVEILREAGTRDGVVTVEIDPRATDRNLYIDYIHLNKAGHRRLARRLHAALLREDELGFPR